MSDTIVNALKLASLGLSVFPARHGEKRPAVTGWQERATSEPAEVEQLFRQFPDCNIAVATGVRSGVFVLDVDMKGADGWNSILGLEVLYDELPETWRTDTPTGNGGHLWFRWKAGRVIGNPIGFRPGLDVRGEGGFVVVPPSSTAAGSYRWRIAPWDMPIADAPDWLIDMICTRVSSGGKRRRAPLPSGSGPALASRVTAELIREAESVACAASGMRNDALFKAAASLGELVAAGALLRGHAIVALEDAAEQCGLVRDDGWDAVRATIDSGLKRGMGNPRDIAS